MRYSENEGENNLSLLYQSLACQINDKQIVIFGGRNMNGFKLDSMMVFDVNDEEKSNLSKTRLFGTLESGFDQPKNILSFAGDFQENSQLILNNSIYFLRKGSFIYFFLEKTISMFFRLFWIEILDSVWDIIEFCFLIKNFTYYKNMKYYLL